MLSCDEVEQWGGSRAAGRSPVRPQPATCPTGGVRGGVGRGGAVWGGDLGQWDNLG